MKKKSGICIAVGCVLLILAQIIIWNNTGYTWSQPYTQFEAKVLTVKGIGAVLFVYGLLETAISELSKNYKDGNAQDINIPKMTATTCPNCGLLFDSSLKICPKCKTELRE